MDYSKHPESKKLRSCKASAHIPEWRQLEQEQPAAPVAPPSPPAAPQKPVRKKPKAPKSSVEPQPPAKDTAPTPEGVIAIGKDSILS